MGRPRKFEKPGEWQDFYRPMDHFALANSFAKNYCKSHPEADRNIVYGAAADAAFEYECSKALQKHKLKIYVNVKIRNAILNNKRKEKEMVSSEERAEMIAEHKAGMSYSQIAEKHNRNKSTVTSNMINWKNQGLWSENDELPEPTELTTEKSPEPGQKMTYRKPESVELPKKLEIPELQKKEPPVSSRQPGMREALANQLPDILAGLLGAGIKITSVSSSEENEKAQAKGVTPEGIGVRIKVEVK